MNNLSLPDKQLIQAYIEEIYVRSVESCKKRAEFHRFIQEEIVALANEFYLIPLKEFVLHNFPSDHHRGYIDVVWAIDSTPIVAIEIDSARRKKSLRKLLASNAYLLFWIYFGRKPFESMVKTIDIVGRINVLHFPSNFRIRKPPAVHIEKVESKPGKSYCVAKIRIKYPNAYKKWSNEQDAVLKEYFQEGLSVGEMANKLQRKPGAILSRLKKVGL